MEFTFIFMMPVQIMTTTIKATKTTKTTKATTISKAKKLSCSSKKSANQSTAVNDINIIPDNWDDDEGDDIFCRVLTSGNANKGGEKEKILLSSSSINDVSSNWDTYLNECVESEPDPASDDDTKKKYYNRQKVLDSSVEAEHNPSIRKHEIQKKLVVSSPKPVSVSVPVPTFEYLGFNFSKDVESRIFFPTFLRYLNCNSIERFTAMQHDLLESLLSGNHFQVLSGCGTGKSFVTVTAFIGLLYETHTLIWVYDRPEQHLQLRKQVLTHAFGASGNLAKVIDVGSAGYPGLLLPPNVEENGLILTPAKKLSAVIERLRHGQKKLIFLFDEAQSIFTADQRRIATEYQQQLFNEPQQQHDDPAGSSSSSSLAARSTPPLMHMIEEAIMLSQDAGCDYQMVFLSAVAKLMSAGDIQPAAVIEDFVHAHNCKDRAKPFKTLDSSSKNNNLHETYIVEFQCHQGIYEQMAHLMLMYLTPGRNLVICRPQQVQPIVDFIVSSDPTITVTSDMDYWMDPKYSVVIVREHELKSLEGVDIAGLTGVFLLTIAHEAVVHRSFQSIGRVGRLGQAVTRAFVFMDKTNWKQSRREAVSQEHLRKFVLENHEAVEVVMKDAASSLAGIRCPRRIQPVNPSAAAVEEARQLNAVANKIHVCPFAAFDGAGRPYLCPRQGSGCRMHHPLSAELVWYRGRAFLDGSRYKTTGRTPDYYRSAQCRCSDDDTVCDTTVCILHPASRSSSSSTAAASRNSSSGKPVFKNKFIQYPKAAADSRDQDARSETSLSSCSTRCVSIAAPVLESSAAAVAVAVVKKTNAWEKPLVGICIEKTAQPVAEGRALPSEARRASAWDRSPSSLFDSALTGSPPTTKTEQPAAVRHEEAPATELCQDCFFYGQCNRHRSRLHLQDSGFAAAAKLFEKTFAETKVCLKGFFEPDKCKFGSDCHRLHKGDARLTAGVVAAFRSFYIRTTAELSGRPVSTCRVNRAHDFRFCYFLHKEDSCKAGQACRQQPAGAEKKKEKKADYSTMSSKTAAAVTTKRSQFAVLDDESSDTDDEMKSDAKSKEKDSAGDTRPVPPSVSIAVALPSAVGTLTAKKGGWSTFTKKAPGTVS